MESYRYQLNERADFEAFIGFLIDNKINFTTNHNYVSSAGDHVYHITVTADDKEAEEIFNCVETFLDDATDLRKEDHVTSLYKDATDAYNDPYCDAGTLRMMLGICLERIEDLKEPNENRDSVYEELKKQVEAEKKSKDYYQDSYYMSLANYSRVKSQIQAIAVLANAIFPKD